MTSVAMFVTMARSATPVLESDAMTSEAAQPPFAPPPRSRSKWLLPLAGVVVAGLVGAGIWLFLDRDFAAGDPYGAQACESLSGWIRGEETGGDGRPLNPYTMALAVGAFTQQATTAEIRAASGNLPKLHAACVGAGVDMPEYREPK